MKYILKSMKNGTGIRQENVLTVGSSGIPFVMIYRVFFQKINLFETCTFSIFGFI